MRVSIFILALTIPTFACSQSATPSTGHDKHQETSDPHASGVDTRGDHAMGFSHETSTHHFRLLPDGGAIEVTANSPNDKISRDEIRSHLSHIARMFTNGNFQVPMFIHDTVPPGVPAMKSKGANIAYVFEPIPNGGRVRIKTTDAEALRAVHQFLTFQIDDHRTGDPRAVAPQIRLSGHPCRKSYRSLKPFGYSGGSPRTGFFAVFHQFPKT